MKCFYKVLLTPFILLIALIATFVIQLPLMILAGILQASGCFKFNLPWTPFIGVVIDYWRNL